MNQLLTNQKVDRDSTKSQNFNGRRITGAGAAVNANDYVIKSQMDALEARIAALEKASK